MLPAGAARRSRARGAFNMHGSLLPKYRGRVPVNWAVLHGERETGATLHEMAAKPDAGAHRRPDRPCRSCPTTPPSQVFDKVTVAAEQVLWRALPALLAGTRRARPNDLAHGSYFGGRKPEDGRIDWSQPAQQVYNLIRAVAPPYPGAFTEVGGDALRRRCARGSRAPAPAHGCATRPARQRTMASLRVCGDGGADRHPRACGTGGEPVSAPACACRPHSPEPTRSDPRDIMKKVLILGVNGFIGHHLSKRILETHRLGSLRHGHADRPPRRPASSTRACTSSKATSRSTRNGSNTTSSKCDVILPLVAIATPATYVSEPLRVFELDFEANLPIVRSACKYGKRLVFPSTSEVYGMCPDERVRSGDLAPGLRPDQQAALDLRVLEAADGPRDLGLRHGAGPELHAVPSVQLDRPGPRLDLHAEGRQLARGHAVPRPHRARREHQLVDGGAQKRAFTDIDDGIDALMKIIENKDGVATGKIYNIGNPTQQLLGARTRADDAGAGRRVSRSTRRRGQAGASSSRPRRATYYGKGYQDVQNRVPKIDNTMQRTRLEAEGRHATKRCARSSKRTAARSPKRASLDRTAVRLTARGADRPEDRRRHAARHARRRAALLDALVDAHGARATFLFSLGPDHTGWALRRVLAARASLTKVSRTSVLEHYGLKTLMYGVLLPGPDIGARRRAKMRAVRDAGFECGIHTWDHVLLAGQRAPARPRVDRRADAASPSSASARSSARRRARTARPAGR